MSDRKKPGVAFWTTVTVVLVMLYVLSIGPAVWLSRHNYIPARANDSLELFYKPLKLVDVFPYFGNALFWYVELWE